MKKLACSIAIFSIFAGCTTAEQASTADAATKLKAQVVNACMVVDPTLQAVAAMDPAVKSAADTTSLVCSASATVDPASVQSLVNTAIPAIEQAVTASALVPADKKPLVVAALGVFQLTLSNAFSVYGQSVQKT